MNPTNRGGRRPGAGRKPTGRRPYLLRMTPEARAGLGREADRAGLTVPEYLDATYGGQSSKPGPSS